MPNHSQIKKILTQIQIVRPPKHRLSTFGASKINYKLVTDVPGLSDRSRLRLGQVTADKPLIITVQSLKEKFQGFGPEASDYAHWLGSQYGEALKGLEYQFRNEHRATQVELLPPDRLVRELTLEFDQTGDYQSTLIVGPDRLWELAIMKFIIEETLSSFSINVQELKERGFFDDNRTLKKQHHEIRELLRRARADATLVPLLGRKLKDYGLFSDYQDEFFHLLKQ